MDGVRWRGGDAWGVPECQGRELVWGGLWAVPSSLGPQHAAGTLPPELSPASSLPTQVGEEKVEKRQREDVGTPTPVQGLKALAIFPWIGGEEEYARRVPGL